MYTSKKPTIAIFCGSKSGNKNIYKSKVIEISKILTKNSYPIIYGGGKTGLMGTLSKTSQNAKGKITGVIPNFLNIPNLVQVNLNNLYEVKNLSARKRLMITKSDVIIILPGGYGTLDELFEALTLKQLGLNNKPIIIYNIKGFWDPLKKLLLFLEKEKFIENKDLNKLIWANDSQDILKFIKNIYNLKQ